jgi:hypothetical protein
MKDALLDRGIWIEKGNIFIALEKAAKATTFPQWPQGARKSDIYMSLQYKMDELRLNAERAKEDLERARTKAKATMGPTTPKPTSRVPQFRNISPTQQEIRTNTQRNPFSSQDARSGWRLPTPRTTRRAQET